MNTASHKHKQSEERYRVRKKQTVAAAEHHINKITHHIPQRHNITHDIQEVWHFTGWYTSTKTTPGTVFNRHRLLEGGEGVEKRALLHPQKSKGDFKAYISET